MDSLNRKNRLFRYLERFTSQNIHLYQTATDLKGLLPKFKDCFLTVSGNLNAFYTVQFLFHLLNSSSLK